jgi:hypothetical protein
MSHDPRSEMPRDDEAGGAVHERLDDLIDDLLDGEDDARLAALLGAVGTRLNVPPDELTRRRHLTAMGRECAPTPLLLRVAQRTGVAAAAAVLVGGVLAGGGWLPDPIQREVADAAAQVGIQLPRPEAPEMGDHGADDPTGPQTDDRDDASSSEHDTTDAGDDPARTPAGDEAEPTGDRGAPERDGHPGPTTPLPEQDAPREPGPDLVEPPQMDPGEERHIVPIEPPVKPEEWERDREEREEPRLPRSEDADGDQEDEDEGLAGTGHDEHGDADGHDEGEDVDEQDEGEDANEQDDRDDPADEVSTDR